MSQHAGSEETWKNKLYFGDNLSILRDHVADDSVDLIYLDPPFNSNANYNVLFAEKSGEKSAAQITAFEDTWHWTIESEKTFQELVTERPGKIANLIQALRSFLSTNDMMAYLTMMAPRMVELHRVLKPTGSIYLHCDPTASHYLKLLMDAIFGFVGFRNEIIWQRTSAHNDPSRYGRVHDTILFYTKSRRYTWNQQYDSPDESFFSSHDFERDEEGKLYRKRDLTAPGHGDKSGQYEWRGKFPPQGRMWSYTKENMERLEAEGRIAYTRTGMPRLKIYADDLRGVPYQDVWVRSELWLNSAAGERLGYPTQKPESLLERIVQTSSNEGDVILDPFCGCGTAIAVAEHLHRKWIGIDVTHIAIALMRHRLNGAFRSDLSPYDVIGDPKDVASADALARHDRYQFECWALGLVDAKPARDKKKGADAGIDGVINFFDDSSGQAKKIMVQVKSGHIGVSQIRDLKGVLDREKAAIGAFITLKSPTREMIKEAVSAGFYEATHYAGREYPRIQILTIEELLSGKKLLYPMLKQVTFKQAERKSKSRDKQTALFG